MEAQKTQGLPVAQLRKIVESNLFSVVASGVSAEAEVAELGQVLHKFGLVRASPSAEEIMDQVHSLTQRSYEEFYRP